MTEEYERQMLREADALQRLSRLFDAFSNMLGDFIVSEEGNLNPDLVEVLTVIAVEVQNVLSNTVVYKHHEIEGIEDNLKRLMEDIELFQAGRPAKGEEARHEDPDEEV